MKLILILLISSILVFSNEMKKCDALYERAWSLFLQKQSNEAEKEISTCISDNPVTKDRVNLLKARIYFGKGDNQQVIKYLNKSRKQIIEAYQNKDIYLRENESKNNIRTLYLNMLAFSGYANFNMGNNNKAINDFLLYLEEHKNAEILSHCGIAYYKLKDYNMAINLLKEAYKLVKTSPFKENISYDIAAIYAVKNDIKNVKIWLMKPLKKNFTYYKYEIEKEDDFNQIRHKSEFIDYLLEFK